MFAVCDEPVAGDGAVDDSATSWWCDDTDNGSLDSLIVTWCCWCILDVRAGDEWWLKETCCDDGDGIRFDDCKFKSGIDLKSDN